MDGAAWNARSSRMLALRYHSIGDLAGLGLEDIPVPVPAAGEVLVRIHAASLNPVDWKIATGSFRLARAWRRTPDDGFGFRRRSDCDRFRRHDARTGRSSVRLHRSLHSHRRDVCRVRHGSGRVRTPPAGGTGYRDAAALACVGATAVTLCNLGHVGAGSKVLVNGATGGVGHVAVQVASARGAIVTATASAARHDFRPLARCACVHRLPDRADATVAGWLRRRARLRAEHSTVRAASPAGAGRPLRHDGARCGDIHASIRSPIDFGGVQRHGVMLKPDAVVMSELLGYVAQGRLHCAIEREFPTAASARGDRTLTLGSGAGKARARHLPVGNGDVTCCSGNR